MQYLFEQLMWMVVNINCNGAFGCYNTNEITFKSSDNYNINCNGLYSCSNIDSIYSEYYSNISCNGELSCVK